MMIRIGILTILLIGIGLFEQCEALRCFSCSYTLSSGDEKCITEPESLGGQNIVSCSKKYCTIIRQEFQDPRGKVNSFTRGCEEKPQFLNDVIEDTSSIFYYRSCTSDLCNAGNGLKGTGLVVSSDPGSGDNLLVRGLPGSSSKMTKSILLSTLTVIMVGLNRF